MKKNKLFISLICVFLALSVALLLVIFLLPPKKNDEFKLSITCQNVSVGVNEISPIVYTVNSPLAKVTFYIEDSNIADIENGFVRGYSEGETTIKAVAKLNDDVVSASAKVVVEGSKMNFHLIATQSCVSDGLTLTYSSPATFGFEVFDNDGEQVLDPNYTISSSEGIKYNLKLSSIILTSTCDGYISFNFYEINFSVTIRLVYMQDLQNGNFNL